MSGQKVVDFIDSLIGGALGATEKVLESSVNTLGNTLGACIGDKDSVERLGRQIILPGAGDIADGISSNDDD